MDYITHYCIPGNISEEVILLNLQFEDLTAKMFFLPKLSSENNGRRLLFSSFVEESIEKTGQFSNIPS